MEKVTAQLRVKSLKVIPFEYDGSTIMGEAIELRAEGLWGELIIGQYYPASLHITLPPGHPVCPSLGDDIYITVERSSN